MADGIPPMAGKSGPPAPHISRKGTCSLNIEDLGKPRYAVEQTFSLLHHFKCPAIR
ncbi:hypothetical protein [Streptomyces sp. V4I8]|uniref:hypothetical protein n=1 Tax=Streptomyces sp. V4I8 TaxID=3156469 RepID=UPI00351426D0